jgi:predicted ATPase
MVGLGGATGPIQETFWAIRRWLEHTASERPTLVVFDDLQWGEPTFLDLVQYVATFVTEHPILLLCMARPELLENRPDRGEISSVIRLDPLPLEDSERPGGQPAGRMVGATRGQRAPGACCRR